MTKMQEGETVIHIWGTHSEARRHEHGRGRQPKDQRPTANHHQISYELVIASDCGVSSHQGPHARITRSITTANRASRCRCTTLVWGVGSPPIPDVP